MSPTEQARKWRSTARWQRERARQLDHRPLCETCWSEGHIKGADEVDHITPVHRGGAFWDRKNFQSLCSACHRKKTAEELTKKPKLCIHGYSLDECSRCEGGRNADEEDRRNP